MWLVQCNAYNDNEQVGGDARLAWLALQERVRGTLFESCLKVPTFHFRRVLTLVTSMSRESYGGTFDSVSAVQEDETSFSLFSIDPVSAVIR